ncbi:MAG: Na+/H+ antiporter subunit E [Pseudomonadota bacterium]
MINYIKRTPAFINLSRVFVVELVRASIGVATAVFSDTSKLRPAILAVPLTVKTDMGIATLANIVSLTPGTTSLHVSDDKSLLYVHVLDRETDEQVIVDIKNRLESAVLAVEGMPETQKTLEQGAGA